MPSTDILLTRKFSKEEILTFFLSRFLNTTEVTKDTENTTDTEDTYTVDKSSVNNTVNLADILNLIQFTKGDSA